MCSLTLIFFQSMMLSLFSVSTAVLSKFCCNNATQQLIPSTTILLTTTNHHSKQPSLNTPQTQTPLCHCINCISSPFIVIVELSFSPIWPLRLHFMSDTDMPLSHAAVNLIVVCLYSAFLAASMQDSNMSLTSCFSLPYMNVINPQSWIFQAKASGREGLCRLLYVMC
jgi:hypothetical protein